MSSFAENLAEPSWWLSVVFVGIAINAMSSLLARANHVVFSRISKRLASRTIKRREERAASVALIRSSPTALTLMIISQNRNLQLGMFQMIGGMQGVIGSLFITKDHPFLAALMMLFSSYPLVRGLPLLFRSDDETRIIQEAISQES